MPTVVLRGLVVPSNRPGWFPSQFSLIYRVGVGVGVGVVPQRGAGQWLRGERGSGGGGNG